MTGPRFQHQTNERKSEKERTRTWRLLGVVEDKVITDLWESMVTGGHIWGSPEWT